MNTCKRESLKIVTFKFRIKNPANPVYLIYSVSGFCLLLSVSPLPEPKSQAVERSPLTLEKGQHSEAESLYL